MKIESMGIDFEDRPELGTRIIAHGIMARRNGNPDYNKMSWGYDKWGPVHGIYAGWRDLQNGRITHDYEEGGSFTQTSRFRCALIIVDERQNPVRVPFEMLTLERVA